MLALDQPTATEHDEINDTQLHAAVPDSSLNQPPVLLAAAAFRSCPVQAWTAVEMCEEPQATASAAPVTRRRYTWVIFR